MLNNTITTETSDVKLSSSSDLQTLVLNIVVPILSILLFLATVVGTYFIDDPGIKRMRSCPQELELKEMSETDRNRLKYLAERKLYVDTKGHTFSAFSPSPIIVENTTQGYSDQISCSGGRRRRACSESHAHLVDDKSSETQVILEHLLIRSGYHTSQNSLRTKSGLSNPFSSFRKSPNIPSDSKQTKGDPCVNQINSQC